MSFLTELRGLAESVENGKENLGELWDRIDAPTILTLLSIIEKQREALNFYEMPIPSMLLNEHNQTYDSSRIAIAARKETDEMLKELNV
jgi:hypothetical protein